MRVAEAPVLVAHPVHGLIPQYASWRIVLAQSRQFQELGSNTRIQTDTVYMDWQGRLTVASGDAGEDNHRVLTGGRSQPRAEFIRLRSRPGFARHFEVASIIPGSQK